MFKKVAYGIIAGSLVFAAQVASADDTQFLIGGRHQGVSQIPFSTVLSGAEALRGAVTPKEQREMPQASATLTATFPAPYNMSGGYFN